MCAIVVCTAHSATPWPADRRSTHYFSGHSRLYRLSYASPEWWGFASAADRDRLFSGGRQLWAFVRPLLQSWTPSVRRPMTNSSITLHRTHLISFIISFHRNGTFTIRWDRVHTTSHSQLEQLYLMTVTISPGCCLRILIAVNLFCSI